MGRLGYGFGRRRKVRQPQGLPIDSPLSPSLSWNGTAGSGFSAAPVDPVRSTAKPALRLVVPPNQAFTDELLVGVYAAANHNGSLLDNMGIEKVLLHYEGETREILAPGFATFADANGKPVTYFGWWGRLAHNGLNGLAHLYVEAIPKDPTMQKRVIGPYAFLPSPTQHDVSVEVAPSQAEIAGTRYQTIKDALLHLASQNARHPLVTITEPGQYDIDKSTLYLPEGYCTITASVPVTIGKSAYTTDIDSQLRPLFGALHFKGANVTFDIRFMSQVRKDGDREFWFDGIRATNSAGTRYDLWRKGVRPVGYFASGSPYFTECEFDYVPNVCNLATLARGNEIRNGYGDVFGDAICMIGNTVDDWDTALDWQIDVDALDVQYTGPETTATIEVQSHNDDAPRPIVARWGSQSETFVVGSLEVYSTGAAGDGYTVQDVADWLNGLPGWTASVIDNSRRASALSLPGLKGKAVPPADARSAPLRMVTCFDTHGDFYQDRWGGVDENVIIADNTVTNFRGQDLFFAAFVEIRDYVAINNAMHNKTQASQYAQNSQTFSQLYGPQSHVVWAHNSLVSQGALLRTQNPQQYEPDGYCLIANNAIRSLVWNGDPLPLAITDNHLQAGFTDPATATGTTIGGDHGSLFGDAAAGDFTPQADLLQNPKPAVVKFDKDGNQRAAQAPAGAIGA